MTALITLLDVSPERGGAADLDRVHDAPLGRRESITVFLPIGTAILAEDIGHLEGRAFHETTAQK